MKKKFIEAKEEKEENIFVNFSARVFPFTFIVLLLSTGNTIFFLFIKTDNRCKSTACTHTFVRLK